ncbi:hypothetical protein Patl1_03832 [Pistacia atlantica]|uniref:Uncharacterized protein n=1 Tax=Pistacia atlantica TaxID=434234 RepID=A0ACC1BUG9_9ROSI|nr:hypothetical protein Patl1_03832 [Pistacia atlantica]
MLCWGNMAEVLSNARTVMQEKQVEHWKNSEVLYKMTFDLQKEPSANSKDFVEQLWQ